MSEKAISGTEATVAPSVETSETLIASGASAIRGADELAPADSQRYAMADEVGRGGLGRIMRATDKNLGRSVAIKELLYQDDDLLVRFAREALVTARLMHPAIVPVYDAGRWPNGTPFYAMKMVAGRSLDQVIRDAPTLQDRLALLANVIAVAEAIAYAHSEGIIHRDLKPANVLVGSFGETVVIDWGLAKDLRAPEESLRPGPYRGDSSGGTVVGSVLGTPSYMPPEQALGDPVDETADVYALGALLYHLLAGRAPYAASTAEAVLVLVITGPPKPLPAGVPAELLAIVDKAMAREKRERYPTASELAADLKRFTTGQLVSAHLYTPGALIRRWIAKRRGVVTIAAIALAALVGVGVYAYIRVGSERDVAERNAELATARADDAAISQARAMLDKDPSISLRALASLSPGAPWEVVRRLALDATNRGVAVRELAIGPGAQAVGFLPSGEAVVAGHDGIYRWSASGLALIAPAPPAMREVLPVVIAPDGRTLAVRIFPGTAGDRHGDGAQLIDVATGKLGAFVAIPLLDQIAFTADSTRVVLAGTRLAVVELATGERHEVDLPNTALQTGSRLAITADGHTALVAGTDDIARCDLVAMTCALIPDAEPDANHRSSPIPIAVDAPGTRALYGGQHMLSKIDLATLDVTRNLERIDTQIAEIAFSPGSQLGALIASAHGTRDSGSLHLFPADGHSVVPWVPDVDFTALLVADDRAIVGTNKFAGVAMVTDGKRLVLRGQSDEITSIAARGDEVASASADGTIRWWHVPHVEPPCGLPSVLRIAISADRRLAVARDGVGIAICDVAADRSRRVATSLPIDDWLTGAISPDHTRVAVAVDRSVVVIDLATGAARALSAHPAAELRWTSAGLLSSSPEGTELFTADLATSHVILPYDGSPAHAQFAPDLAHGLVRELVDGKLAVPQLLELATMKRTPLPDVYSSAFSPDGKRLAYTTPDGNLRVRELGTGETRTVAKQPDQVFSIDWTPDSARIVTLGDDALRIWAPATGASRTLLRTAGRSGMRDAAFSPDGTRLFAITGLSEAFVVDVASGESVPLGATGVNQRAVVWPDGKHFSATGSTSDITWFDPVPSDHAELRAWLARAQMTVTAVR